MQFIHPASQPVLTVFGEVFIREQHHEEPLRSFPLYHDGDSRTHFSAILNALRAALAVG